MVMVRTEQVKQFRARACMWPCHSHDGGDCRTKNALGTMWTWTELSDSARPVDTSSRGSQVECCSVDLTTAVA